jgi:Uncharacterized protein conserved in bacteria (DUF2169)
MRPRPVVVAQADARARGRIRDPLRVGVVRWRGTEPRLSVVVKLTLSYAASGHDRVRVSEPEPVQSNVPNGVGGLDYASDFVALKPRCDLTLVGHAHHAEPAHRIPVGLTLGDFTARWRARSSSAARAIPLSQLFDGEDEDSEDKRVSMAPLAVVRERAADHFDDFDHASTQSATVQLDGLAPDAEVRLEGLAAKRPALDFRLPGLVPRALSEDARGLLELPLRCDGVHLDSDYERIVLVWRAPLPPAVRRIHRIVVSLEQAGDPRAIEAVLAELPRGTVDWAAEETALEHDPEDLEMASYELLEHVAEPELSLEQFAVASARVAEQDRPRDEILDELDLAERSWTVEERAWTQHMGDRAMQGDGTLAADFATLFLAAQDALRKPEEPRSMEVYAKLKAALERADKPKELLDEHEICFGEWMRLERHHSDAAAADGPTRERLDELLAAARAASRQKD